MNNKIFVTICKYGNYQYLVPNNRQQTDNRPTTDRQRYTIY